MKNLTDEIKIVDFIKSIELKSTDVIFISSDISKLAFSCKTKGEVLDTNEIIDCFQEIVNEGTIIFPAYTDNLIDGNSFDWKKSKPTTGAFSNKVQRRKDFIRTKDPLHSVFVWGKHAKELSEIEDTSTFGKNSVFTFLKNINAKFIFIDIHIQSCFTYIHYIEEQNKVNYRKSYYYNIECIYPEKTINKRVEFYSKKLGVMSDIMDLHAILQNDGVYKSYTYRNSQIDILEAQTVWNYAVDCIENGPKLYKYSIIKHLKDLIKRYILRRKGIF